jgi:hypothetical protein
VLRSGLVINVVRVSLSATTACGARDRGKEEGRMINRPAALKIVEYLTVIRSISTDFSCHLNLGKRSFALRGKKNHPKSYISTAVEMEQSVSEPFPLKAWG